MKFFDKTHKNMSLRAKLAYIQNHNRKDDRGEIMLANNIKVYNLPLTGEQLVKAWEVVTDSDLAYQVWDLINCDLDNFFDEEHIPILVSGRSGGYLVLPFEKHSDDWNMFYDNYKQVVSRYKDGQGYSYHEAQYLAKDEINRNFDLVQKFDRLCDCLLEHFKEILDEAKIEEVKVEKVQKATYKKLTWA